MIGVARIELQIYSDIECRPLSSVYCFNLANPLSFKRIFSTFDFRYSSDITFTNWYGAVIAQSGRQFDESRY